MKSTDTYSISAAPLAASIVLADPRFYLGRASSEAMTAIELVDHRETQGRVHLEVRYAFTGSLNSAARAILDPSKLTWVQVSDHDVEGGRVAFGIQPDHYPDRLRCKGRYVLKALTEDSSTRTVATELHVRAPLVAGQVEAALMDGLRRELQAQALAIPDYVP